MHLPEAGASLLLFPRDCVEVKPFSAARHVKTCWSSTRESGHQNLTCTSNPRYAAVGNCNRCGSSLVQTSKTCAPFAFEANNCTASDCATACVCKTVGRYLHHIRLKFSRASYHSGMKLLVSLRSGHRKIMNDGSTCSFDDASSCGSRGNPSQHCIRREAYNVQSQGVKSMTSLHSRCSFYQN